MPIVGDKPGAPMLRARRWAWQFLKLRPLSWNVPGTSGQTRRALRLFWLDGLLISASVSLVSSYLTLYALEFGATSSQIGLMSTVVNAASMLALLPGARLAERWMDPKRMVLVFSRGAGQAVWAMLGMLPFFLSGLPAVYGILLLRATRAFVVSASNSPWTALAAQIVPQEMRGKYFAARNIAKQGAALLVIPAAGWLIDSLGFPLGYQICFGLAALVGIAAWWTYARIPFSEGRVQSEPEQEAGEEQQGNNSSKNFSYYCATSALWTFSMQFAAPFFSVYLVEGLGAGAALVGTLAVIASLTALPGQAVFGRLHDRRDAKWTLTVCGLLIPFLAWGWLLVTGPWGALPINVGSGFLWAGYNLSSFNMLLSITPNVRKTRQIALYQTIVQLAAALAPSLGGLMVDRLGFLAVFAVSGAGRMLSTLLLLRFVREPEPSVATGSS